MRLSVLLICLMSFAGLWACKKSNAPTSDTNARSGVMFVNVTASANQGVWLAGTSNSSVVSGASRLLPFSCSPYCSLPTGQSVNFAITPVSAGNFPASDSAVLPLGQYFSFFAYGKENRPATILVPDNPGAPVSGTAKIRFANMCVANPKLSGYFANNKIDSGLVCGQVNGFIGIVHGTGLLMMQDPGQPQFMASIPVQSFVAGKIYTVVFTDTSSDGQSGFRLVVINNF